MKKAISLNNIGVVLLVFVIMYILVSIFAFGLGESSYGMKDQEMASLSADIANKLAGGGTVVVAGILSVLYVSLHNLRKREEPFLKLFICASFALALFVQVFAMAYPYTSVLATIIVVPSIVLLLISKK